MEPCAFAGLYEPLSALAFDHPVLVVRSMPWTCWTVKPTFASGDSPARRVGSTALPSWGRFVGDTGCLYLWTMMEPVWLPSGSAGDAAFAAEPSPIIATAIAAIER